MGEHECKSGGLKSCIYQVPIFNHLEDGQMAEITEVIQSESYKKGEIIYRAGEQSDSLYVVSVLGPAQPDEIQIMVDYVDSISQITYMQTTQLKGCEVREYTADNGAGIGVILPDYFITVEIVDNISDTSCYSFPTEKIGYHQCE
jgi:hypothetical protein